MRNGFSFVLAILPISSYIQTCESRWKWKRREREHEIRFLCKNHMKTSINFENEHISDTRACISLSRCLCNTFLSWSKLFPFFSRTHSISFISSDLILDLPKIHVDTVELWNWNDCYSSPNRWLLLWSPRKMFSADLIAIFIYWFKNYLQSFFMYREATSFNCFVTFLGQCRCTSHQMRNVICSWFNPFNRIENSEKKP